MATWQDAVLAAAAVVFFVSLIPSMLDPKTRIPRRTSVPTALAVYAQAAVFASLDLLATAAGTLLIALAWTHLAVTRGLAPHDRT